MAFSHWKSGFAAAVALSFVAGSGPISAQTFSETLINAVQSSPTLDINRAALRSLEEGVIQAAAGKRPVDIK